MDSILFFAWRLIDWYRREGVKSNKIPSSELSYFRVNQRDLFQGIIDIRGVRTKHYSHPEIEVIFKEAGFRITAIERLEYDWETEFASPPSWMKEPYPWDWLVEVKK
jgi:hypothetical protein